MRKSRSRKQLSYSFVIMRDDGPARTMHLRRSTFLFILLTLFFIFALSLAGCIASLRYMFRYYEIQTEYKELKQNFIEARLQLEQLSNVKTLLEQTESDTVLAKNDELNAQQSLPGGRNANASQAANASLLQHNASQLLSSFHAEEHSPEESPVTLEKKVDSIPAMDKRTPLRISGFSWKSVGPQELEVQFDLHNQAGKRLTGTFDLYLQTKNGKTLPVTLSTEAPPKFSMNRSERMKIAVPLPDALSPLDLHNIIFVATLSTGPKWRWNHQLSP